MELKQRQVELYQYMVFNKNFHPYQSLVRIMIDLDHLYHRKEEKSAPINSTAYRQLRGDIEAINKSTSQYAIVSVKEKGKLKGYKVAERNTEILKAAEKHKNRALREFKRYWALVEKVSNDGQMRIAGESTLAEIKSTIGG